MLRLRRYERILMENRRFWRVRSVLDKFSRSRGTFAAKHFCTDRRWLPYYIYVNVADSIHTKKLCSRLFFKWSSILHGKQPFVFLAPFGGGGGLRVTDDVPLRIIRKLVVMVVDSLMVLTKLFRYLLYGEALRAIIDWKLAFAQKYQVAGVPLPHNHSSCQKTRMNDLSCGMRMWTQVSLVLSQCTRLSDRQTDRNAIVITCVALHESRVAQTTREPPDRGEGKKGPIAFIHKTGSTT